MYGGACTFRDEKWLLEAQEVRIEPEIRIINYKFKQYRRDYTPVWQLNVQIYCPLDLALTNCLFSRSEKSLLLVIFWANMSC